MLKAVVAIVILVLALISTVQMIWGVTDENWARATYFLVCALVFAPTGVILLREAMGRQR